MIVVRASIASHDGNEHGHLSLDGFEVGFDMNVMRMKDTDDEETRSSVPHFWKACFLPLQFRLHKSCAKLDPNRKGLNPNKQDFNHNRKIYRVKLQYLRSSRTYTL